MYCDSKWLNLTSSVDVENGKTTCQKHKAFLILQDPFKFKSPRLTAVVVEWAPFTQTCIHV